MQSQAILLLGVSSLLVGCATSDAPSNSVRERMTDAPIRLQIDPTPDAGSVGARRWSNTDGWVDGAAPLAVSTGEVIVELDHADRLVLKQLAFAIDHIDLPNTLIGSPLQLRDIHAELTRPPSPAAVEWRSDDEAAAGANIELSFDWSIDLDGNVVQLGAQKLPALALELALVNANDHLEATMALSGDGTLWSFAGLLELTHVDLQLAALAE